MGSSLARSGGAGSARDHFWDCGAVLATPDHLASAHILWHLRRHRRRYHHQNKLSFTQSSQRLVGATCAGTGKLYYWSRDDPLADTVGTAASLRHSDMGADCRRLPDRTGLFHTQGHSQRVLLSVAIGIVLLALPIVIMGILGLVGTFILIMGILLLLFALRLRSIERAEAHRVTLPGR